MSVSEKTTENSEWGDQQARPGFEPGTSRLPVFSVTAMPLVGPHFTVWHVYFKATELNSFPFSGAFSNERPSQLEIKCGVSVRSISFLAMCDRVKFNERGFLKCSEMFLFHHPLNDDRKRQVFCNINVFDRHNTSWSTLSNIVIDYS